MPSELLALLPVVIQGFGYPGALLSPEVPPWTPPPMAGRVGAGGGRIPWWVWMGPGLEVAGALLLLPVASTACVAPQLPRGWECGLCSVRSEEEEMVWGTQCFCLVATG